MKSAIHRNALAAAVLLMIAALPAIAQDEDQDSAPSGRRDRSGHVREERSTASSKPVEQQFPGATRTSPETKPTKKLGPKLQKISKANEDEKYAEARAMADEVIADGSGNAYDHAIAAQMAAGAALDSNDTSGAMAYLQKAVEFNGLDNNAHFGSLLTLAQLQLQEDKYADALATIDRFLTETKSQKPEHLVIKGSALYNLQKFPEAVAVMKQAIAATPDPRADWMQLLMSAYFESDQTAEAAKLAEQIAAKKPDDKRAQTNLATIYQQIDMFDKSAAVMEKLRAAGQMTEDKDYRVLYTAYLNMEGQEKKGAEVIDEGLKKGVLQPDFKTYLALAQAYYFSDQAAPAIDAYRKAAPLAPDGETYLNLARVLWQENRIGEAKEAAKQAIAKGVKKPDEAKKILALPGK